MLVSVFHEMTKKISNQAISRALQVRGVEVHRIDSLLNRLQPLYDAYSKLKGGTLYVIGIPRDKIERFAYDSKSFGIPTGRSLASISQNPGSSPVAFTDEEGGPQVRLMMFKETLRADSGIDVIDINTPSEVSSYCESYPLVSPDKVFKEKGFFPFSETGKEQIHRQLLSQLDSQVKSLVTAYKSS